MACDPGVRWSPKRAAPSRHARSCMLWPLLRQKVNGPICSYPARSRACYAHDESRGHSPQCHRHCSSMLSTNSEPGAHCGCRRQKRRTRAPAANGAQPQQAHVAAAAREREKCSKYSKVIKSTSQSDLPFVNGRVVEFVPAVSRRPVPSATSSSSFLRPWPLPVPALWRGLP